MSDSNEAPKGAADSVAPTPDRGRRRLLQGGVSAAPLLTLVSRPVLGQEICQSTSAATSMPTSHAHGQLPICSGGSPTFWSAPENFSQWPAGYYPITVENSQTATAFSPPFLPTPYPSDTTLLNVLGMADSPSSVASHLVAARLNVAKGWAPVLNDTLIQTIWLEYTSKGYFEPTAGVKWYQPEIVAYLQTLETK